MTVSLLEEKGYDPMVYRLFCLQSHYRKALTFSWENLDNAKAAYEKLVSRIASLTEEGTVDEEGAKALKARFDEALGNDLNTSLGVTALYDVLKADVNDATKRALIASFDTVLGLRLLEHAAALQEKAQAPGAVNEEDAAVQALVDQRSAAKKAKDFATADAIRAQLGEMGIEVTDTPQGPVWKRV